MDQQLTSQEKAQVAQITQELLSKQTPQGSSQAFVPKVIKDQGVISPREWSNMPTQEKAYCISLALCAEIICGKRAAQASNKKSMKGFDDMDYSSEGMDFDSDSEGLGDLKFMPIRERRIKLIDKSFESLKDEQNDVFAEREKFLSYQVVQDSQILDHTAFEDKVYDSKGNQGSFISNKILNDLGIPKTINRYKNYVLRTKSVRRTTPEKTFRQLSDSEKCLKLRDFVKNLADRTRMNSAMIFFLADAIDAADAKIMRLEEVDRLSESIPMINFSSKDIGDDEPFHVQLQKDIFCFQHYIHAIGKGTANPAEINPMNENKPDVVSRTGLLNMSTLYVLCQLINGDFKNIKVGDKNVVMPEMVQRLAGKIIRNICHPQITNAMVHANNLNRSEYKAFVYPVAISEMTQAAARQTNAGGQIGIRR